MNKDNDMAEQMKNSPACAELEQQIVFYACDELSVSERAAVEEHVAHCAACAASLAEELCLRQMVASAERPADRLDASGLLLARCRSELAEALDDISASRARGGWLARLRPGEWFHQALALHPAWSAAMLVLLGVTAGVIGPDLYRSGRSGTERPNQTVLAQPQISPHHLQNMSVAGINWAPGGEAGMPQVEVLMSTEKPVVRRGSLDDLDIKRVLMFVVQNGQKFDSDIRLESINVLQTRSSDVDVRHALCAAARTDSNVGVRLNALKALRGIEQDELVRQTLLDALVQDQNPGVRVEAVNALRALAERTPAVRDAQMIEVLRNRMERDPNSYIRMQSAAAMRQLAPGKVY